ncbi:MAG TPA: hypothetical protein VK750_05510 [Cytophagaceae bacterium]|nr:hypothetical protein [Cytophagaceae bacterium]
MDKFTFNRLIENPALVKPEHVKALQKIVEQYPYCQPAKILLTKSAYMAGHMTYEKMLHQASAGMLDRKKLKYWISLTDESVISQYSTTAPDDEASRPKLAETLAPDTFVSSFAPINKATEQDDLLRNLEETLSSLRQARNRAAGINKDDSELVSVPQVNIFEKVLPFEQLPTPDAAEKTNDVTSPKKIDWPKRDKKILPQSLINDFIKTEHPEDKKMDLFSMPPEQSEFFDYTEFKEVQKNTITDRLLKDKEKVEEIAKDFPVADVTPSHIESSQSGDIVSTSNEVDFLLSYLEHNKRKRRLKNISKDKVNLILNKFIQEEPTIKPAQKMTVPAVEEDLSEQSSRLENLPASENFAQLLILQGKYSKAIEVFEELMLKNPEKKPYFASRIEDLKNNLYS